MNRLHANGLLGCLASLLLVATANSQDTIPKPANVQSGNVQASSGQTGDQVSSDVSYALGLELGLNLRRQGFKQEDIELASLTQGIRDSLSDTQPKLSKTEIHRAFQKIDEMLQARIRKQMQRLEALAEPNLKKAKEFLAENGKKEGVFRLPSGLQYKVLKGGSGQSPTPQSMVRVHYVGRLLDGTVFDSSVSRGQPAELSVGGVIPGWTEALQKMKVGDKWELYIPPDLAYGSQGTPPSVPGEAPDIGPNEALIFEVELIDILN